jgi:hypothetical protein
MTSNLTACVAKRTFPWPRTLAVTAVGLLAAGALALRGDATWAVLAPLVLAPVAWAWALGTFSRSPVGEKGWTLVVRADEALEQVEAASRKRAGQVDTFTARALYGAHASREATVAALVDLRKRERSGELSASEVSVHLREHEGQVRVLEELSTAVAELVETRKEALGRRGRSEVAARVASERTGGVLAEARRRLKDHHGAGPEHEVVLDVVGARTVINSIDVETGQDRLGAARAPSSVTAARSTPRSS